MEYLPEDERPRGLPPWVLWAALPVVVALGFVFGMGLAVYLPPPALGTAAASVPVKGTEPTGESQPTSSTSTGQDSSWLIVTSDSARAPVQPASDPWDLGSSQVSTPAPAKPEPFTGPSLNVRDARKALQYEYGQYQADGVSIPVEYQQMTQSASATGLSLVGIISAEGYAQWEQALRLNPGGLKRWLESAALRAQPAAQTDRFHLAWAVVDVLREYPEGFATNEVIPLNNRTFLVVRPLAATEDHTKSSVVLRPLTSLAASASGRVVTDRTAWTAYGPLIRFDTTDRYRPDRTNGAIPLKP